MVRQCRGMKPSEVLFWGGGRDRKGLSDEMLFEERPGFNGTLSLVEMGAGLHREERR